MNDVMACAVNDSFNSVFACAAQHLIQKTLNKSAVWCFNTGLLLWDPDFTLGTYIKDNPKHSKNCNIYSIFIFHFSMMRTCCHATGPCWHLPKAEWRRAQTEAGHWTNALPGKRKTSSEYLESVVTGRKSTFLDCIHSPGHIFRSYCETDAKEGDIYVAYNTGKPV